MFFVDLHSHHRECNLFMEKCFPIVLWVFFILYDYCIDFDLHTLPEEEQKMLRLYYLKGLFLGDSKLYSIDVECVATGYRHCDRDVAKIAIVNAMCDVVYESFVKPELEVVSYLTPLTGITYNRI